MKKIFKLAMALLGSFVMAFAAGCIRDSGFDNGDGSGDSGDTGGGTKTTINVWVQSTNEPQFFTWAAARFKQLNPNITINWTPQSQATLGTSLDASLSGSNAPDIASTWGGLVVPKLVAGNNILKVGDVVDADAESKLNDSRLRLEKLTTLIKALSPMAVVERGFAIVYAGDTVVKKAADVRVGQELALQFADGRVEAKVEAKETTR